MVVAMTLGLASISSLATSADHRLATILWASLLVDLVPRRHDSWHLGLQKRLAQTLRCFPAVIIRVDPLLASIGIRVRDASRLEGASSRHTRSTV